MDLRLSTADTVCVDHFQLDADQLRTSYDAVAEAYATCFVDELASKPSVRELLNAFVAACPPSGNVLDVGCGPGHVARYLSERGVTAAGMDLSPEMVTLARSLHPGLDFTVGDMRALANPTHSLAGIVAFYSIIHIPRGEVPPVLAEFSRVLVPGGRLLLSVHGGSGIVHQDEFLGTPVPFEATLFSLAEVVSLVEQADFTVDEATQREPYEIEHPTPRIYVAAHQSR